MKKYNIQNYIRYKEDLKSTLGNIEGKFWDEYTRDEMIIKFLPLVETMARKFSTSQQASGILSIMDLLQQGSEGLIKAVDRLEWETLEKSDDIEKTLKSFFSKRIKGTIRRQIDKLRGNIRIPEHQLNNMRKNKDKKMVEMFFNSIFLSIDAIKSTNGFDKESWVDNLPDTSEPYNVDMFNVYLKSLLNKHLDWNEAFVLSKSYGLDGPKWSAKEIANALEINGVSAYVRVSELKKQAVTKLIDTVDHSQVLDYL